MKRLLKVTAMTGLLTLLKMAVGFVIAKVVAVNTGPTGMAMLGQVQSLVGSLNGIINAPAGSGVVRYTAEYQPYGFTACSPWWKAALQWILVIAAITIPLGLFLANEIASWLFQDAALRWIVIVTVCVLPISAIGTLCNSIVNGLQLYRHYVKLGVMSTLISSCITLWMIINYNIKGALLAAAIQSAIIGLVLILFNIRQPWCRVNYWWGGGDRNARMAIGGYMLMAITSALVVPLSLILVRGFLIEHVGWSAAGQWQAVWKISEVYLGVITMALSTYYLPRLASINDVESIVSEINRTAIVIIPIVAVMAFCIYLSRDIVISLLFTEEFRSARDLFFTQLIGDVIKIASWLYAYPMLSRGATKWFIGTEILFALSFVSLAILLIPSFGTKGATVAYLLNYVIYFFYCVVNCKRFSK